METMGVTDSGMTDRMLLAPPRLANGAKPCGMCHVGPVRFEKLPRGGSRATAPGSLGGGQTPGNSVIGLSPACGAKKQQQQQQLQQESLVTRLASSEPPIAAVKRRLSSASSSISHYIRAADERRRRQRSGNSRFASQDEASQKEPEHYKLLSDPPEMVKRSMSGRQALFANQYADLQLQRQYDHFTKEYHDQVNSIDFSKRQLERSRSFLQEDVKRIRSRKSMASASSSAPARDRVHRESSRLPNLTRQNSQFVPQRRCTHHGSCKCAHIDTSTENADTTNSIYAMRFFENEDTQKLSRRKRMNLQEELAVLDQTSRLTVMDEDKIAVLDERNKDLFLTQIEDINHKNGTGKSWAHRSVSK